MSTLEIPVSPRTKVFRKIDSILRNDAALSRVIPASSFRSWRGLPDDAIPLTLDMAPAIRITPINQAEAWKFPDAMTGMLFISCELLVPGYDIDDLLNVWWAIERAIYPSDGPTRLAQILDLQAVGAYSGLAEFNQPAYDPQPESNYLAAIGQIQIEVLLQLNS